MRKGEVEKESWRGWTRARVSEPFPKLEEQGDFGYLGKLTSPFLPFPFLRFMLVVCCIFFSIRSSQPTDLGGHDIAQPTSPYRPKGPWHICGKEGILDRACMLMLHVRGDSGDAMMAALSQCELRL